MGRIAIAVDGPAGSGKGTVARRVAGALGYTYVDTGALYRGVGLALLRKGADPRDPLAAAAVARRVAFAFSFAEGRLRVTLDGEDVTDAIRAEPVSVAASAVATHPEVRAALMGVQQALARGGAVIDGRDIGTVVLPNAELKVFLDATLAERARRRHADVGGDFGAVLTAMEARDAQDRERIAAPLRPAGDAVVIDSTDRAVDAVVEEIVGLARQRGA